MRGMLTTAFRLKAGGSHRGYAHKGICKLYNKIVDTCGCRVIYLTARPIRLMNETRGYVNALQQEGQTLPAGAVCVDIFCMFAYFYLYLCVCMFVFILVCLYVYVLP